MKTVRAIGLMVFGAACAAQGARAEQLPAPGLEDARVRTVAYSATEVYRLQGFPGYAIHLQFAPGERFQGLGAGDIEAVSFLAQDNHLFLKPKAAHVATNLTLLTSERTYHIDYSVSGRSPELNPGALIYSLTFVYPAEEARQAASRAAASKVTDDLRAPTDRILNRQYAFCGAKSLRPTAASDDGVETELTFPARAELPAIYVRNEDGSEALVNFTVEADRVRIHRVAPAYVLRRGKLAGCIVNQGYAGGGSRATTGTVSPSVERADRGAMP